MSRSHFIEIGLACGLAILAVWLLFSNLGASAFHDGDEALYAAVAQSMKESGDWINPVYWDAPFLHKPPLPYWLMAASFALVPGSPEFQARFPSALAALLMLALVYWTTRRLSTPWAAAAAVLVLLSNHQLLFEHGARSANFDALLALLMFAAVVAGACADRGRVYLWLSAATCSLVTLVKAPLAGFPFAAVLVYLAFVDRRAAVRFVVAVIVAEAVLALPWHAQQLLTHGRDFWNTYVAYEMLGRTGAVEHAASSHAFIHVEALWRSFIPWSPLLAVALVAAVAGWRARALSLTSDSTQPSDESTNEGVRHADRTRQLRLLAAYALAVLIVFSFVPSKWPWYGMPAAPAIAVVGAVAVAMILRTHWAIGVPVVIAALALWRVFLVGVNAWYEPAARPSYQWPGETVFLQYGVTNPAGWQWIAAGAIVVSAAMSALPRWRGRPRVAEVATGLIALVAFAVTIGAVARVPQAYRSATQSLVAELEQSGVRKVFLLGFYHERRYGGRMEPLTSFYLRSVKGADVIDCGQNIDCVEAGAERAALVVDAESLTPRGRAYIADRMAGRGGSLQVWLLRPSTRDGLERLAIGR